MEKEIIEFVKQNPLLYDKACRSQRFADAKEKKWNELAKKLGTTRDRVRGRWRTLRDRYYREHRRPMAMTEWKYMASLDFLLEMAKEPKHDDAFNNGECEIKPSMSPSLEEDTSDMYEPSAPVQDNDTSRTCEDNTGPTAQSPDASRNFESVFMNDINDVRERTEYENYSFIADQSDVENTKKPIPAQNNNIARSCPKKAAALAMIPKRNVIPLTPTRAFFNSLGLQVEAANLPNSVLFTLQRKVMHAVHQSILDFENKSETK